MAERATGLAHPRARACLCNSIPIVGLCCSILAIAPATASEGRDRRHEGATEVFHCTFDEDWDVNYDAWPDRWQRDESPEFPHYVKIEIRDSGDASLQQALVFELDGAGASVKSPPVRVMPRFMYKLETSVRTENVYDTQVVLLANFFDEHGNLLERYTSDPIQTHGEWTKIHVGPVSLSSEKIDRVVIGIQTTPGQGNELDGKVWIDDVWLARLPRMTVRTNNPFNVYSDKDAVVVVCEVSGIHERDPEIRFQLFDEMSKPLNGQIGDQFHLGGRLIAEDSKKASDLIDGIGDKGHAGYEGERSWKPPLPDYGYYRVTVRMLSCDPASGDSDEEREMYRSDISVAVVPPLDAPSEGEFAWTLPDADRPHSFSRLTQLLPKVGINRVKLPAWYDPGDDRRGDEIVQFAELLGASNIDVVGMIVEPPPHSDADEHFDSSQSIANLFLQVDPAYWQPSLDPVMTRLALRVRWWQLGSDRDRGFAETANIKERMTALQPLLFRFGQEVNLGFGWPWDGEAAPVGRVPWEFEVYSAKAATGPEQLSRLLSNPQENTAERWVLVEPTVRISDGSVSAEDDLRHRVRELLGQIVAAKEHAADAIIFPDPFHDEHGLMRADGSPGELLLPWRTAASMLSAAEYLGQLQLPGGSENRVFLRKDGEVVMVVWNDESVEESLYLGDDVRQFDCWGRKGIPRADEHHQVIEVGPFPSYVLGLNEPVAQWRMAMQFERSEVPSVFRVPHPNSLRIKNTFGQGVGGKYSIVVPHKSKSAEPESTDASPLAGTLNSTWNVAPPRGEFALAAGEDIDIPLEVVLKGASYGQQPVRIDFEVDAESPYVFSVFRTMHVGLGNITITLDSHLDENESLVVEQRMSNLDNKLVDFNCYLHAEGYRRQRAQVYRLGAEENVKKYIFPNGASLVGTEMLLEAQEVDGLRTLKYEFTVTE